MKYCKRAAKRAIDTFLFAAATLHLDDAYYTTMLRSSGANTLHVC